MRGFCSANISHLNLCSFVEGEQSTWQGTRDIGPAAFDKRLEGYKSVRKRVDDLYSSTPVNMVADISPQTDFSDDRT